MILLWLLLSEPIEVKVVQFVFKLDAVSSEVHRIALHLLLVVNPVDLRPNGFELITEISLFP